MILDLYSLLTMITLFFLIGGIIGNMIERI